MLREHDEHDEQTAAARPGVTDPHRRQQVDIESPPDRLRSPFKIR
ncbi:hypothetical protein AB0I99_02505 [Streptomyces spongiicola]